MRNPLIIFVIGLLLLIAGIAHAAPVAQNFTNIQPFVTDTYDNGTSSLEWFHVFTKYASTTGISAAFICLTGDTCRTTWPTGGSGGSGNLSTSSPVSAGNLLEYSSAGAGSAFGVATTTPSIGSILTYSGTLGSLVGGVSGTFGIANSAVTNAMLANSSLTINGTAFSLGDSKTITAASSTLLSNTNTFTGVNNFANLTFANATGTGIALTGSSTVGSIFQGGGLSVCTGASALTYNGTSFTCTAQPQGTVTSVSGTTNANTKTTKTRSLKLTSLPPSLLISQ